MTEESKWTTIAIIGGAVALTATATYYFRFDTRNSTLPSIFQLGRNDFKPKPGEETSTTNPFQAHVIVGVGVEKLGPIFRIPFTNQVIVADAATVRHITTSSEKEYGKSDNFQRISFIKLGLVALHGQQHQRHRKLLQPAFGPSHLRAALDASYESSNKLIKIWSERPDSERVVDVYRAMTDLTSDVIAKIAFSYDFGALDAYGDKDDTRELEAVLKFFSTVSPTRAMMPWFLRPFYGMTVPQIRQRVKPLTDLLEHVLQVKRDAIAAGTVTKGWQMDVLDRLLQTDEETGEKKFDSAEIMDEALTFYAAGHETSANSLTFIFLRLAQNPDVCKKVQEEIDRVIGPNGRVTNENIGSLTYLEQVFKETQRIDPVVVGVQTRVPAKDVVILGHKIKAGTKIVMPIKPLHFSEKYWDEPHLFKPERFEKVPVPGSFLPFGDGAFGCIGMKLAQTEIRVVLATVLQQFTPVWIPQNLVIVHQVTTGLKNGLWLYMEKRS
ncbi:hypothetical protein SmJEL517_g00985 [Synchytrium microbalum]|uniref:Cytochrome P450 n=1 Tax=Synchytrium microbalum TaxID=1806994 RepID=A0A507CHT5_9FUNG|nr:uncharacterized protein SmJEL517_g00985 [Synchytrium microbalum]TPX37235.1 hypothetical protein SmJEL517_g00985 [Synchytrium microbalum]